MSNIYLIIYNFSDHNDDFFENKSRLDRWFLKTGKNFHINQNMLLWEQGGNSDDEIQRLFRMDNINREDNDIIFIKLECQPTIFDRYNDKSQSIGHPNSVELLYFLNQLPQFSNTIGVPNIFLVSYRLKNSYANDYEKLNNIVRGNWLWHELFPNQYLIEAQQSSDYVHDKLYCGNDGLLKYMGNNREKERDNCQLMNFKIAHRPLLLLGNESEERNPPVFDIESESGDQARNNWRPLEYFLNQLPNSYNLFKINTNHGDNHA